MRLPDWCFLVFRVPNQSSQEDILIWTRRFSARSRLCKYIRSTLSKTMRTFTCLAALFLLAAAVSAAPFNEDDWSEETVGTDTALTLFDTAGTAGIPEVFLSQDQPWIRPFAMDHSRKWLSMTEEEKDAFAEQHARNAIAAARARGDMVLSDADVELMLPTVKEACKMVGEVLWNNGVTSRISARLTPLTADVCSCRHHHRSRLVPRE